MTSQPTKLAVTLPDGRRHVVRFGVMRGEDEQASFKQAHQLGTDIESLCKQLQAEGLLTKDGIQAELAKQGQAFAAARAKELKKLGESRAEHLAKMDELIKLTPPSEDDAGAALQHARLLDVWNGTKGEDRTKLIGQMAAGRHEELARALVREPLLVTGLSTELHERLHEAVLGEAQMVEFEEHRAAYENCEKVTHAWGSIGEVMTHFCGAESMVATEVDDDVNKPPNVQPNEYLALANGATFEIGAAS